MGDAALPALPAFEAALWHRDRFVREYAGRLILKLAPGNSRSTKANEQPRPGAEALVITHMFGGDGWEKLIDAHRLNFVLSCHRRRAPRAINPVG